MPFVSPVGRALPHCSHSMDGEPSTSGNIPDADRVGDLLRANGQLEKLRTQALERLEQDVSSMGGMGCACCQCRCLCQCRRPCPHRH